MVNGGLIFLGFIGTDVFGDWSLLVPVPADPALECAAATLQAIILPAVGPPFYQVTDGLGVVLGY